MVHPTRKEGRNTCVYRHAAKLAGKIRIHILGMGAAFFVGAA
jgi:hypothetical protein